MTWALLAGILGGLFVLLERWVRRERDQEQARLKSYRVVAVERRGPTQITVTSADGCFRFVRGPQAWHNAGDYERAPHWIQGRLEDALEAHDLREAVERARRDRS